MCARACLRVFCFNTNTTIEYHNMTPFNFLDTVSVGCFLTNHTAESSPRPHTQRMPVDSLFGQTLMTLLRLLFV